MTWQATVSTPWVDTVLDTAARLGAPRDVVLVAAGLAVGESDGAGRRRRWHIDEVTRLWRAAARCTGDPAFGLKVGARVDPASLEVIGRALPASATLREGVATAQKYQRLVSDGARLQAIAGPAGTWLVYHPRQGTLAFSPHQVEAVLAAVVCFARRATGRRALKPLQVQFNQPAIGALAGYRAVFRCTVAFDQAFSGVLLDNALLDAPLPRADARLARAHHQRAAARLAELSGPQALVQALRHWIAAQPPGHAPTREQAARAMGLGARTLARRMATLGVDFSSLLDDARRDAALHAVAHEPERTLAEIGQRLGFAEPSTFWRAFRRWTGETPAAWRARASRGRMPPAVS